MAVTFPAKHSKWKLRGQRKKRKHQIFMIIFGLTAICLMASGIILFCQSHQTYYKFNDWLVLGHSAEQIERRYGEMALLHASQDDPMTGRYLVEKANHDDFGAALLQGLSGKNLQCDRFYYIYFDESGTAQKVALWEIGDEGGYRKKLRENKIS